MEKKVYFYVITYHWEGSEELSYFNSPVLYSDKIEFIKQASSTLFDYTNDPCAEVVGFKTISYDLNSGAIKELSL